MSDIAGTGVGIGDELRQRAWHGAVGHVDGEGVEVGVGRDAPPGRVTRSTWPSVRRGSAKWWVTRVGHL